MLKVPWRPYSVLLMFLLVVPAADLVARWWGDAGLATYGMGFQAGWWQGYLFGMEPGLPVQLPFELPGIWLRARGILMGGVRQFPCHYGNDLLTRGYW